MVILKMVATQQNQGSNFYSLAKNNPEVLENRKKRVKDLEAQVDRILKNNPGRKPNWDEQRLMQIDKAALSCGKRCIMWDDQGEGFYLMMNWDWVRNQPAQLSPTDDTSQPGWWINIKSIMKPPLLDPTIPDASLAAWLDTHTMKVHRFLDKLHRIKQGPEPGSYTLE